MKHCILALLSASGSTLLAADWIVIKVAEAEGFVRTHAHIPSTGELVLGNGGQMFKQQGFGGRTLEPFELGSLIVDPSFIATSTSGGLLGAGGFGSTGVYPFEPSAPTQAPGAALATLQNFDGVFWKHPVHQTSGWIVGGGNGTLTSGPFGDFKQHNLTFVSTDGSTVKAITGDLSTYSSGMATNNQGDLYLGTSDTNPVLNNRVLMFSADAIHGAITGSALTVNEASNTGSLPTTGSLALDSTGRLWASGFERDVILMRDNSVGIRLFKPDHPAIFGAGGPVLYQVKTFTVAGVHYVSFLASDQYGVAGTPVYYGWKKVDELASRVVSFALTAQNVSESSGAVSVEVRVFPAPTKSITVPLKISGTATKGVDYTLSSQSIKFQPGQTSKTITLNIRPDVINEPGTSETIVLELDHPIPNSHCGISLVGTTSTLTVNDVESLPVVTTVQNFPTLRVGTSFNHQLSTSGGDAIQYSATGLPKGLKLNPKTGEITGRPEVPGEFVVVVKATNALGTSVSEAIPMEVQAIAPMLVGQFVALGDVGERLDLNVKPNAFFTGGFRVGKVLHKLSDRMETSSEDGVYSVMLAGYGSLSFTINKLTGNVMGASFGGPLVGWRATNDNRREGRHHFQIAPGVGANQPEGFGFGSIVVDAKGQAIITGRVADNSAFLSVSPVSSNGDVAVYQPLYENMGHLIAMLNLDGTNDRVISGNFMWKKPPQSSGVYAGGWSPQLVLSASGGRYRAVAGSTLFLGATPAGSGNADLTLSGAGIASTVLDVSIAISPVMRVSRPNNVTTSLSKGLVSGNAITGGESLAFRGIMVPKTGSLSIFDGTVSGFFVRQGRTGQLEIKPKP
ncbi:MAG: putative Ig domain-containing protein [Verrucomicrobiaceae bacterium]|nr:putative Ig domain-containing protein [Verrucomicrobiaceae bacterium]